MIPITRLPGVGPHLAKRLAKINIVSIFDLLLHLPFRYQDRTHVTPILYLKEKEFAVIEGEIIHSQVKQAKRKYFECKLQDSSGVINIRFFHYYPQQVQNLTVGVKLRCFGEAKRSRFGLEMTHPECQRVFGDQPLVVDEHLTAIYPSTEGISQWQWRKMIKAALMMLKIDNFLPDFMPATVIHHYKLPTLHVALMNLHQPSAELAVTQLESDHNPWRMRLAFEELLIHHLSLRRLKMVLQENTAHAFQLKRDLGERFLQQLPFQLTSAQQKTIQEIKQDLIQSKPMLRLVQGDVGCGKTVVAAMAILLAVDNHFQAALMAPTEILAEQHYRNFQQWFAPLGIEVVWIAGKVKGKKRQAMLELLANGQAKIAIGTHALFQEQVDFKNLGLVVIDEQHRFGVHQRLALREKGVAGQFFPHQLVMSATPIPRTLAMLYYADLDCSIIDELPPGRTPVRTVAVPNSKRDHVIERVQLACRNHMQAYWVCTLIDESEILQCQAAEKTAELLAQALPDLSIGLVHGRLKAAEKEVIMQEFKQGKIQLLVATTVIEVGVDVANASLMVIENPERLGLSQLHQLRGRVGRGNKESYCVLLYQMPLSQLAKKRLAIMRETNDGFKIAKCDLELRGAGEVLGTKQTGMANFRVADLQKDQSYLDQIQEAVQSILNNHKPLVDDWIEMWLPRNEEYASV